MGIYNVGTGSVGDYSGILRNYKVPVIPWAASVKIRARSFPVQAEKASAAITEPETLSAVIPEQTDAPRKDMSGRNVGVEEITFTFNRQEDFEYIGRDIDIHSLDVEKAIDEMKKDEVLHQYQYFVGSLHNLYVAEK